MLESSRDRQEVNESVTKVFKDVVLGVIIVVIAAGLIAGVTTDTWNPLVALVFPFIVVVGAAAVILKVINDVND